MNNPLVSIIILTYANNLEHMKKCLSSFANVNYQQYEIIVVDNASTDNTVAYIKKHFPKVKLIESKKNLGFCEGNNVGLKKAKGDAPSNDRASPVKEQPVYPYLLALALALFAASALIVFRLSISV